MKFRTLVGKIGLISLIAVSASYAVAAQKAGSSIPRQEKLLNGMKLLMWNDPSAAKVTVSLRIHSGSAFDPQGKEGTVKLLAENIFPNEAARDFFVEDLGGSLEIVSNYDYIQINASSYPSGLLTMLETIAQAVSTPTIDKETTETLKKALVAQIIELEKDPAYIADRAVAKRLFGSFPYGRPQLGTEESVAKIDFADLLFVNERLFGADNATLAITGNYSGETAYRAVRRFFGSWLKSDKKIPSTFRQPDEPDTKVMEGRLAGINSSQVRFALRGLARNDNDYAASQVLTNILNERFRTLVKNGTEASVEHNARILPGAVVFRYTGSVNPVIPAVNVFAAKITDAEFIRAKAAIRPIQVSERWLDVDTYKLTSVTEDAKAFETLTLADVQRVADRLSKNPVVTVVVLPDMSAPAASYEQ